MLNTIFFLFSRIPCSLAVGYLFLLRFQKKFERNLLSNYKLKKSLF